MDQCSAQAQVDEGPPPPSGEVLKAYGADATTQFDATLDLLDWMGRVVKRRSECVPTKGDFQCGEAEFGAGCYPADDMTQVAYWDPKQVALRELG